MNHATPRLAGTHIFDTFTQLSPEQKAALEASVATAQTIEHHILRQALANTSSHLPLFLRLTLRLLTRLNP